MKKVISVFICLSLAAGMTVLGGCGKKKDKNITASSGSTLSSSSEVSASSEIISEVSSEPQSSQAPSSETASPSKVSTVSTNPSATAQPAPTYNHTNVSHNGNVDINNNVFYDSLVYTGYNINKHISDGMMWQYVLSKDKRGLGWLSNITYGGGSTGYETNAQGKPDIARFEKGGLVCASYVTYVYFNYLPNIAGIDTSMLARPEDPKVANSWYQALKKWESAGYSKQIDFNASGKAGQFMKFIEADEIPIGSIICLKDGRAGYEKSTYCTHVCIYAGYKNNYHWVYHVGNSNGPEFCAIERMLFGPDPQMMLAVFTTPFEVK